MSDDLGFFLLLLSNGVLIGLMYSLIALGFVLVYKATDAVNFAQGEFVMIAGLVVALALERGGRAPLGRHRRGARRHGRLRLRPRAGGAAHAHRPAGDRGGHGHHRARLDPARARVRPSSGRGPRRCPCPSATSPFIIGPALHPAHPAPGRGGEHRLPRAASGGSSCGPARASPCARSPTTSRWPWPWASTWSATSGSPGP